MGRERTFEVTTFFRVINNQTQMTNVSASRFQTVRVKSSETELNENINERESPLSTKQSIYLIKKFCI